VRASDWWPTIPPRAGPDRDAAILQAVAAGHYLPITWCALEVVLGQLHALIGVSSDALRIGEPGDALRVPVSARLSQQIADELSRNHETPCHVPTAFLDDLAWNQAARVLPPHPMTQTTADVAIMDTTARSAEHSAWIDQAAAELGHVEGYLLRNVGKSWINWSDLWWRADGASKGINYGWHCPTRQQIAPGQACTLRGGYVIQPPGDKHNDLHSDYSQTLTLVSEDVMLTDHSTGEQGSVSLASIALDNQLCGLVSHNGPVPMRHPGVPCEASGDGTLPPSCPVPGDWRNAAKRPPIASLEPWKRALPVTIAAIGIGTALALSARRKA
jgi:hypothetical protein